jgi:hypothetical protein
LGQIGVAFLGWRGSLSEPSVKALPGLKSVHQQFYTTSYVTLDVTQFYAWARYLAEPVRFRQFPTSLQQFAVQSADIANRELSRLGWRQWLAEPARYRQIPVSEVPFATQDTDWTAARTAYYGWGKSWPEPIRTLASAVRYHAAVFASFPKASVTVTMNLIEFNQDVSGFAIGKLPDGTAKDARISIVEVSS